MSHEQKKIAIDSDAIDTLIMKLLIAFDWRVTVDGEVFWESIHKKLTGLRDHATSDYKPLQPKQPEITDEWLIRFIQRHGRRPSVQVRDHISDEWSSPHQLIAIWFDRPFKYGLLKGGVYKFCKLAAGEPLE